MVFFLIGQVLFVIFIVLVLFLINFYRDPKRKIPQGESLVSPADGRVISIIKTKKEDLKIRKGLIGKINTLTKDIGKECHVISIFMSPVDVHYNRTPIEGKIVSIKHTPGKFFRAYDLEKSLQNEKNEVIIKNKRMKIKVIQISGFLARRIHCFVEKNQNVNKGDKIGFISLGSQATMIIPSSLKVKVKKGDYVKAGSSIIATI